MTILVRYNQSFEFFSLYINGRFIHNFYTRQAALNYAKRS